MALSVRPSRSQTEGVSAQGRTRPDAKCPLRPGDPCTLCQLDVTGPQDCPLVWLVRVDDELSLGRRDAQDRSAG